MQEFGFHPLIAGWFGSRFAAPTEPQCAGWPAIASGEHTLIAAPTGSGKTLTAFLACIDRLLREAIDGRLEDETRVVYVSPLRALSNDMHRNLEVPLAEILAAAREAGHDPADIRVGLRTGDTTSSQRAALVRRPPHILVTTPESLYLLLTAEKGRAALRTAQTVIVDEIHALVRDKRGSHLALSLERLDALCERRLQRIGLSATQKPIERIAQFLVGVGKTAAPHGEDTPPADKSETAKDRPGNNSSIFYPLTLPSPQRGEGSCGSYFLDAPNTPCRIVDVGHRRNLDLAIEVPPSELGAVCTHEQWEEIYKRIVELINSHRSTLIFVNTRRLAERVTHQLTELLGEGVVGSHHGSLSARLRLDTEARLKSGELKAVVATASLELGLDVGYIDLVIQIGSPRSIATLLQRIGRSGHSLGLVPKGRLLALTRDELLESMSLIRAVHGGRLDVIPIPEAPLDVLAQQIVAEVAGGEWSTDELFALFRQAYPYRRLSRDDFDRIIETLSEGIVRSGGRSRVYLHHDQVHRRVRARKGARIAAATNAGAIPEIALYRVVADDGTVVGTLDEDFSIESQRGDIFLLGNTSWRILNVRGGDVNVADAQGAPPSVPFWRGEAPGRTFELSEEVARLREEIEQRLGDALLADALAEETGCTLEAAQQAVDYCAAQKAAIGLLPSQRRVVFERFFDETGGMQLVVHAPYGAAINRAWGLAMRKRFCRSFDFELQATADDDGFILSLGPQHSFPIESLFSMLTPQNARRLLEQAVLTIPMFQVRWRWNVTRALLVLRRQNGKKVPPAFQRFRADDLLTAVFPKLTGCQENVVGDLEVPDHPLARQTMEDCLHEGLDLDGLLKVLAEVERGDVQLIARDTREPSPFCYELLNSNVYAFLDGGEIQERRARAVTVRRTLTVDSVRDLGRLDPAAIEQVRRESQPLVRSADELHDLLLGRILLPEAEAAPWQAWLEELAQSGRAARLELTDARCAWVAAERWTAAMAAFPKAIAHHPIEVPATINREWTSAEARVAMVRGLMEVCGPATVDELAERLPLGAEQIAAALEALEGEGDVLRGHFTQQSAIPNPQSAIQWCHRRLLARIHRLTMAGLRRQIEPVDVDVFVRFLTRHHGLMPGHRRGGANGVFEVVAMLQGVDVPAVSWEADLLPARIDGYQPERLDELCLGGEIGWGRLFPSRQNPDRSRPMASITRVAPVALFLREDVDWLFAFRGASKGSGSFFDKEDLKSRSTSPSKNVPDPLPSAELSTPASQVLELLQARGAMFAADLARETFMLRSQLDEALGELIVRGHVTADSFAGLRGLIKQSSSKKSSRRSRTRGGVARKRDTTKAAGRWGLWRKPVEPDVSLRDEYLAEWAWQLLRRWGVVFRDLLAREPGAPSWFELLGVYRRLEARGEIRGGRFIRGVGGEQFALGDTVRQLRQLRDEGPRQEIVALSAADPLNLIGILTDHARVPSIATNRILYLDGNPVASLVAGELGFYNTPTAELRLEANRRLGGNHTKTPAVEPPASEAPLAAATTAAVDPPSQSPPKDHRRQPRFPSGIPRPRPF